MKKKRKKGLVFVHGDVFKDGSRNVATFKMELFATIVHAPIVMVGFTTNGQ